MIPALLAVAIAFQPAPCAAPETPPGFEQQHGVECGWVSVPLAKGSDKVLRVWTARVRASGPVRQPDPILYVNGGPGIATVDSILPTIPTSKSLQSLRVDRDILLFDQRGSGRSEQALCPTLGATLAQIAEEGLSPAAEEDRSRSAFAACRSELERAGIDLRSYSTAAIVEDMEGLRRAFGVEQWNLLAISYGSLVAMHAMRVYPHGLRSVILNSPYPPNSVTWAEQVSSTAAAYEAIERACDAQPACRQRFGALVPKLQDTLARLEREPLKDDDASITGRQFAKALWPLAVRSSTVKFVPLAIDRAHAGDAELIHGMVRTFADGDSFGQYSPAQGHAIACHEGGRTREWYARARALYPSLVPGVPDDSWDRLCAVYRSDYAEPSFFAPVASTVPTLIYAGTLDPATPVVDAYQAMRFLTSATLVQIDDAAHGPMGIDECTRGIAAAFVREPRATPDVSCVAKRKPIVFATEGLDALLSPSVP